MKMERLKRKFNRIPKSPGVYFFKNRGRRVIYVGKAAALRSRIKQYFQKTRDQSPRWEQFKKEVADLSWKTCDSETDALIEEARLIKQYHPKFNVIFRDDKNYSFVCVTRREPYPRPFITHQPFQVQSAKRKARNKCIGPFTNATALRQTLRMLRNIYPYCTANPPQKRPCLAYHLGRCLGACVNKAVRVKTRKNVQTILRILGGRRKTILRQLEENMKRAARHEQFHEAQAYKEQLKYLHNIFAHRWSLENSEGVPHPVGWSQVEKKLQTLLETKRRITRVEGYDISNIVGKQAVGSMVAFEYGIPKKSDYRRFKIKYSPDTPNDPLMMKEVLRRRLRHTDWPMPDLILLDGGRGQLSVCQEVLPKKQLVIALAKREEEVYLPRTPIPVKAASFGKEFLFFLQRLRDEAHRFAISYHRKLRRKIVP